MAAPHDRRKDHDDDATTTAWSAPRPSPGAMGAAHDDVFGVPSAAPREPDSDAEADIDAGDAETDVEGGADDDDERSVGAEETDIEGRSGATKPDGDGSRTSVV